MPEKAARELKVRMYRQGLGDCFLITFPRNPKPFHLMIDCGALNSKHYDVELMKKVVEDIRTRTGGELDAVAATHEHWDHISGFLQAEEIFKEIKVASVWASWTEEPENSSAQILKDRFKKNKKAVQKALEKMPDDQKNKQMEMHKHAITELFGFFGGLGAAAMGNTARAWANYMGLSKKKIYCNPKKPPLEIDGVDDVRVFILGPPEDPEFVKKKLSKIETYDTGKNSFSAFSSFAAAFPDEDDEETDAKIRSDPFDRRHQIQSDEAKSDPFFSERYGFAGSSAGEWRRIDHDWLKQAGQLALHLDSYTNNTCLAMAIELGKDGKVLLFPGDAQVGNWLSWNELSWKVAGADGKSKEVKIGDLLARTVLYKVGHHGSHNATLREKGLEKMTSDDLVAMIPVHRRTAEDQKWEFPYEPLWKALREKCRGRVLLADAGGLDEIKDEAQKVLADEQWESFKGATDFDDLSVEYTIKF